jgi:hypothetical protein
MSTFFLPRETALLHPDVNLGRVVASYHLLVGLRRLVKQLHEQLAGLAVLAPTDHRQLVQLLRHHAVVVQRVFEAIPERSNKSLLMI